MPGQHPLVGDARFTLHRQLWHLSGRLPRLVRVWLVLAAAGAMVKLALLSGVGQEERVRAAVATAVREATGPDPASSCSALSPAGLSQMVSQFGAAQAAPAGADLLLACRQLVPRLRAEPTPQQLADLARGRARAVQLRPDGSALVVYVAADGRLGAELTMSERAGRWLIDSVAGGAVAGAQSLAEPGPQP
jgi:hypothetical protein